MKAVGFRGASCRRRIVKLRATRDWLSGDRAFDSGGLSAGGEGCEGRSIQCSSWIGPAVPHKLVHHVGCGALVDCRSTAHGVALSASTGAGRAGVSVHDEELGLGRKRAESVDWAGHCCVLL
jgi:hypothetical protein